MGKPYSFFFSEQTFWIALEINQAYLKNPQDTWDKLNKPLPNPNHLANFVWETIPSRILKSW